MCWSILSSSMHSQCLWSTYLYMHGPQISAWRLTHSIEICTLSYLILLWTSTVIHFINIDSDPTSGRHGVGSQQWFWRSCDVPNRNSTFYVPGREPVMTSTSMGSEAWLCDVIFDETSLQPHSAQDHRELLLSLCTTKGDLGGAPVFPAPSTEASILWGLMTSLHV